ncbi:MAG: DUF6526 family protein [Candidatus Acidiferrum sp.]|jgi:hypothetical protein
MAEQNFSNHVRWVPVYHFFVLPVFVLNFGWSIFRLIRPGFSWDGVIHLLTAAALFVFAINARVFALAVQDRVIRIEERQRLARLLPEDLRPRIGEFTKSQLVALRFASDEELPGLARKVLNDKVADIKAIKQMVKNWRADYMRA